MVEEGHIVANHTVSHPDMTRLSKADFEKELGYMAIFWSTAYVDWDNDRQPSAESAFGKLMPGHHHPAAS